MFPDRSLSNLQGCSVTGTHTLQHTCQNTVSTPECTSTEPRTHTHQLHHPCGSEERQVTHKLARPHLFWSNMPMSSRHVSWLKWLQLLFTSACLSSLAEIFPEPSASTDWDTHIT